MSGTYKPEGPDMTAVEAEVAQAKKLAGYNVEGVCISGDSPADSEYFGLILRKGKKRVAAWVNCDPEGNGPGHLAIEEARP